MDNLQQRIGYTFKDANLLRIAMTHSSVMDDTNYERLEFLGDRVLGLIMADLLYHRYPDEHEGDLAKRHAALVQGYTLAKIAERIDLGSALILSDAERAAGGAGNENMLADGMEALLGAIYIDAKEQGLFICKDLIIKLWDDMMDVMIKPPQDSKTALQEWAQGRGLPLPAYELIDQQGPDHAPEFTMRVTVKGYQPEIAVGTSRRLAEKRAAKSLLSKLQEQ